ncbi:T9SS C-terminal target domain-containing protein [candidate division KSB1 bacterium]|nr:MAG: T9SS C-terminal target domain-containing protein [candidate division KSB1 bacterium]
MRRSVWFATLIALVLTGTVLADISKMPVTKNYPVRGGANDVRFHSAPVTPGRLNWDRGTLDSAGTAYIMGNTWYDQQHNGTSGKMLGVDNTGYVHTVWMKGMDSDNDGGARHVYYNLWDPASSDFLFPGGVQADAAPRRAGYANLCVLPSGWVFPTFHDMRPDDPTNAHAGAAMDLQQGMGIFSSNRPAYRMENGLPLELIWPKISVGRDSTIHMVSTENPASGEAGDWQRVYYSRGRPTWDEEGYGMTVQWDLVEDPYYFKEIDTVMVIAGSVTASKISDRVAISWVKPRTEDINVDSLRNQYNNDVYMMISEDAGLNWYPEVNVTDFAYPDLDCQSGDTAVCDRDTFRVYTDCASLFDHCDRLHLAFTTRYYWELEGLISRAFSDVWHWSEEFDEISNITHGEFTLEETDTIYWIDPGAWQLMVQRPNLAEDPITGYLYCSYSRFDSEQVSEAGWPMGDAYVAVSRNAGRTWSEGTNVSDTDGGINATAGQCKSERDINLAEHITYTDNVGYVHMFYVFDTDAGTPLQDEGTITLNPCVYRRIPVNDIPATPINPWWQANIHADSSNMPGRVITLDPTGELACSPLNPGAADDHALRPESFHLYQNYPNPFNPTTNIQFDLVRSAKVTLNVYNVMGQVVATLYDAKPLTAGAQSITFDASNLASGVYVYRIEVDGIMASHKMILLK